MKTKFVYSLILYFLFSAAFSQSPFIHRSGRELKDGNEKTIQLRGVNLGGWLLWEGWIWGDGFHSHSFIFNALAQMTSKEDAQNFRDSVYLNFISETDIKKIAESNFNAVRIPFNHRIFDTVAEPSSYKGIGWSVLDSVLKWCAKYKVYAVLDLHGAPGGQSNFFIADGGKENLWKSEKCKERTIALWKAIAERYKNNAAVAGYDLLNEPIPNKKENLFLLYQKIIAAIRESDKNHLLILEGSDFAKDFSMFSSLPDENMAFSFHLYTWLGGDAAKKILPFTEASKKLNAPMWAGEWGENNYELLKYTRNVFENPANNFCGWSFWTWKKTANKYPALNRINASVHWTTVIEAIQFKVKRKAITKEFALQAMKEFLISIRYENNRPDPALLDILKPLEK